MYIVYVKDKYSVQVKLVVSNFVKRFLQMPYVFDIYTWSHILGNKADSSLLRRFNFNICLYRVSHLSFNCDCPYILSYYTYIKYYYVRIFP